MNATNRNSGSMPLLNTSAIKSARWSMVQLFVTGFFAFALAACNQSRSTAVGVDGFQAAMTKVLEECQLDSTENIQSYVHIDNGPAQLQTMQDDGTAIIVLDLYEGQEVRVELILETATESVLLATATTTVPGPESGDTIRFEPNQFITQCGLQNPAGFNLAWGGPRNLFTNSRPLVGSPALNERGLIVLNGSPLDGLPMRVLAFDTSGNNQSWPAHPEYEAAIPRRQVAIDQFGTVYSYQTINSEQGIRLLALNTNGEIIASYENNAGGELRTAPSILASGEIVYPASTSEVGISSDLPNPEIVNIGTFGNVHSKGAISRREIVYYTLTGSQGILAFDVPSRQRVANISCLPDSGSRSSPAIDSNDNVIFGTDGGTVYSCDSELRQNWNTAVTIQDADYFQDSPVIDSADNIYIRSNNGNIYSLTSEGNLRWVFRTGITVSRNGCIATPIMTNQDSVIFTDSSGVTSLAMDDGSVKWKFTGENDRTFIDANNSATLTPDGILVFRAGTSLLGVVVNETISNTAAWPKWGADLQNTGRAPQ